jgi:Fur family peroxide stress response transcriptional regulator
MKEHIINKLKDAGLKITPQRITIMEYMEGNTAHPSAEDIYEALLSIHPNISFATVYNIIEKFREKGLLLELTIDKEKRHYDPNTEPHHHFICLNCKAIIDIHENLSISLPDDLFKRFEIIRMNVEFYGICNECKKGGEDV